MLNKLRIKRTGGNMVVSALLTVIISWILVAFYFWYFGQSLDKNDFTKVSVDLRQNLADASAQVRNGANIILVDDLDKLSTKYNSEVVALDKKVNNVELMFWSDLSWDFEYTGSDGNLYNKLIDWINNNIKYLVLTTNTDIKKADWSDTDRWVILIAGNNYWFTAANHNADEAGLTYRGIYFLVPASEKATWNKIASANIWKLTVSDTIDMSDGKTDENASAILITTSEKGE